MDPSQYCAQAGIGAVFTSQYLYYLISHYENAYDLAEMFLGGVSSLAQLTMDSYMCFVKDPSPAMKKVEHGIIIYSAGSYLFGMLNQFITGGWKGGVEELSGLMTSTTRLFVMDLF